MSLTESDLIAYYNSLHAFAGHALQLVGHAERKEPEKFTNRLKWFGGERGNLSSLYDEGADLADFFPKWGTLDRLKELEVVAAQTELYRMACPVSSDPVFGDASATCWSGAIYGATAIDLPMAISTAVGDSGVVHWWRGEVGAEARQLGIPRIAKCFAKVRAAVVKRFEPMKQQFKPATIALRKELAVVLIEMRRDKVIKPSRIPSPLDESDWPTEEELRLVQEFLTKGVGVPNKAEDMPAALKAQYGRGFRKQKLSNIYRILRQDSPDLVPFRETTPRRRLG